MPELPEPPDRARIFARLDAIGVSLRDSGQGLALLGLGSVGQELNRLDEFSDLDFFAIVKLGAKGRYIDNLDWLERVAPVAFSFANTADGRKLLFGDGIFCEYAVFEPQELAAIPYAPGRIVWSAEGFDAGIASPRVAVPERTPPGSPEWLLGEALTNLYVGLGHELRGEKLSAARFVQSYAVDRVIDLAALLEAAEAARSAETATTGASQFRDPFSPQRRVEQRHLSLAVQLPDMVQGYGRSRESARAIFGWLEKHFAVSPAMSEAITQRCARAKR